MNVDSVLEALSSNDRREILYLFSDKEQEVATYDQIIEELVEKEYLEDSRTEQFEVQMHHHHLPKLAETGFIDYDKRSETIRYTADSEVEDLLEETEHLDRK